MLTAILKYFRLHVITLSGQNSKDTHLVLISKHLLCQGAPYALGSPRYNRAPVTLHLHRPLPYLLRPGVSLRTCLNIILHEASVRRFKTFIDNSLF